MASITENPNVRPMTDGMIRGVNSSSRGVIPYIQQNFGLAGEVHVSELKRQGPAVQLHISAQDQKITVVTLSPNSSFSVESSSSDTEFIPYVNQQTRVNPPVIIESGSRSIRQLGDGLTLPADGVYRIRTKAEFATVIIRRTFVQQ